MKTKKQFKKITINLKEFQKYNKYPEYLKSKRIQGLGKSGRSANQRCLKELKKTKDL